MEDCACASIKRSESTQSKWPTSSRPLLSKPWPIGKPDAILTPGTPTLPALPALPAFPLPTEIFWLLAIFRATRFAMMKPSPPAPRQFSAEMLDGPERAVSRAMLYAVGFKKEDFGKPIVGIASTWSQVTPCNVHIDQLARAAAAGADAADAKSLIFNTVTVSDGISMGTEGMKYSLVSREVIADSIETVAGCEGFDGIVAIGGCDKNMPGCVMAMARLNRPAIFVYGGTILPGNFDGKPVDVVSVFEAVGQHANQKMTDKDLFRLESCAIPGAGSCGGMYTANTMASAIEALGMSLSNSSAQAAVSEEKRNDCEQAGEAVMNLIKQNIRPRDIMTRKAFET